MEYKKKLIEVDLPLEDINRESKIERRKTGNPFRLHHWWARRPLAAARAIIWSSLVDDPSAHPELFPTEEDQNKERERLFDILRQLVKWENSNNEEVLNEAKVEILKYTNGKPPALLDPFAGGGSIPLEAQRLGLEAHAHDLNPVAVLINKAMIEIPPKFANQPPINPAADTNRVWKGAEGLADDVRYYGELMKQEAWKKIGHLYPNIVDENGCNRNISAWIWARTVVCPNPACHRETHLIKTFQLFNKGTGIFLKPIVLADKIIYTVNEGIGNNTGTIGDGGACCLICGNPIPFSYLRLQGKQNKIKFQMIAIVAEPQKGKRGKSYFVPNENQIKAYENIEKENGPEGDLPEKALGFRVQAYGLSRYQDLFNKRQLKTLMTFGSLIRNLHQKILADGATSDYADAIAIYLTFVINKIADFNSTLCNWQPGGNKAADTFKLQAVRMAWDYAEANVFGSSYGSWSNKLDQVCKSIANLKASNQGYALQKNAQNKIGIPDLMISTDPPYFDNISYSELSDFFYVWLRKSLFGLIPELFATILTPKSEELIASPFRFSGKMKEARTFFKNGMTATCKHIYESMHKDYPFTIYYAYKEDTKKAKEQESGWDSILSSIIESGFTITATWPMRMDMTNRTRGIDSNALASTIVIVCRKRPTDAPVGQQRDFLSALRRELRPALKRLQAGNIAPVDLPQAAIGPGIAAYSRYSQVLEADGSPMSVRAALAKINEELDAYLSESDSDFDRDSGFCLTIYEQFGFDSLTFGEADTLARAKNTSVDKLADLGSVYAKQGTVRLFQRDEVQAFKKSTHQHIWILTQQVTQALKKNGIDGAAKIVAELDGTTADKAKDLAYRLFRIAETKGRQEDALDYNALVQEWPNIQLRAESFRESEKSHKQKTLFE